MTAECNIRHLSFDSTYRELLELVLEARDFVAEEAVPLRSGAPTTLQFEDTLLISRLTVRLADMMAWMLARKAVYAGEMTCEEAQRDEYCLSTSLDKVSATTAGGDAFSQRLGDLLGRSAALFARVARLDEMVRAECDDAIGDGGTPVRVAPRSNLFDRAENKEI